MEHLLKQEFSKAAFDKAKRIIPGGVNSPVRAFASVGLTPVFAAGGKGARIYDIDGNEFIDYIGSWGPLILGHAHPQVIEAIREIAERGTSFGLATEIETKMAELICAAVPSVEMVRMVNSGTEAVMSALRLARGYTKRQKILKFQGGYHGHSDGMLIKSGSGVATLGLPDSPGVPDGIAANTLTAAYNSLDSVRMAFELFGEQIAAVIVEPVAGNMGVVPPLPGFLQGLREITLRYGSLLIFDEVITGFRVDYHGAQGLYGIRPDLTCLGKVIGCDFRWELTAANVKSWTRSPPPGPSTKRERYPGTRSPWRPDMRPCEGFRGPEFMTIWKVKRLDWLKGSHKMLKK